MRLLRVSIYHCKAATAALQKYVIQQGVDFVLIQEPWLVKGRISGLKWAETRNVFLQSRTKKEYASFRKRYIT